MRSNSKYVNRIINKVKHEHLPKSILVIIALWLYFVDLFVAKRRSIIKGFASVVVVALVFVGMFLSMQIEADADETIYSITDEEIRMASLKSAGMADIIMTADDFLMDGERAADYEDIHEFIDDLKINGFNSVIADENTSKDTNDSDDSTDVIDEVIDDNDYTDTEIVAEEANDVSDAVDRSVDASDWRLILVNKQNMVPDGYEADLGNINGSLLADERIIPDIYEMLDAAKADGVNLMICSAYRSYDRQTTLFNNKMKKLMSRGMSYMDAYAVGSMSVTVPGTSEHQLGLALDILTSSYTEMDDGFGETEAGKWLAANAPKYGFILRYPAGKEEITGIIYEPWHFRYVGKEYSEDITELGVTLEEYLDGAY